MRWLIFFIFLLVFAVIDNGAAGLLALGHRRVTPDFLLILATFVGMLAPRQTVVWAFLAVGLLADIASPGYSVEGGPQSFALIGPLALGYLVAAYGAVQLRGMVYRESLTALAVLTFILGIMIALIEVTVLKVRMMPMLWNEPLVGWRASDVLFQRFLELLYTMVVAAPVGFLLARTSKLWGFDHGKVRGGRAGRAANG